MAREVGADIYFWSDHWLPASFDTIILNGVFGFGLDCVRDQDEALRACRLLLKEKGWLILGWNFDRSAEPSELPTLRDHFQPSSFPSLAQRQMFDNRRTCMGLSDYTARRNAPQHRMIVGLMDQCQGSRRNHGFLRALCVALVHCWRRHFFCWQRWESPSGLSLRTRRAETARRRSRPALRSYRRVSPTHWTSSKL